MNGMSVKSMYIHISYLEIQITTKKILNNKCHLSHFLYIKRIREEIKLWKLWVLVTKVMVGTVTLANSVLDPFL